MKKLDAFWAARTDLVLEALLQSGLIEDGNPRQFRTDFNRSVRSEDGPEVRRLKAWKAFMNQRPHTCHAMDCETECPPEYLMCGRHWRMVPKKLQRRVWATYREGQCDDMNPSAEWHVAADAAICAVAIKEGKMTKEGAREKLLKSVEYARKFR